MDKRGQGLSTNAIILIILGVIVLVILAIGFIAGWDKIVPWIKPTNNVDKVVQACQIACSTNSVYDFCTMKRELKSETETVKDKTCKDFATEKDPKDETKFLYAKYGIADCPGITCP